MHCLTCKKKTGTDGERFEMKAGKRMRKGKCAVCGRNKCSFAGSQKGGSKGNEEARLARMKYEQKNNPLKYAAGQRKLARLQRGGNAAAPNAKLSNMAYKNPADRVDVGVWKYQPQLSSLRIATFANGDTAVVAFRGTQKSDKDDLAVDAALLAGGLKLTNQFKRAKALTKRVMQKYPNVSLTGHSKGSTMAAEVSRDLNVKSHGFSAGAGFKTPIDDAIDRAACLFKPSSKRCKQARNITNIRAVGDPLSVLGRHGVGTQNQAPSSFNPHSLSNFNPS